MLSIEKPAFMTESCNIFWYCNIKKVSTRWRHFLLLLLFLYKQKLNTTPIPPCCSPHYILSLSHKHTHKNLYSASLIGNVNDELCFVSLSSVFISSVAVCITVSLLLSCISTKHLSGDPAERISSCWSACCCCWSIIRCHWGRNLKGLQIHKIVTNVKWREKS